MTICYLLFATKAICLFLGYNAMKRPVDRLDKLIEEYSWSQQTNRMLNKVFFNMVDMGAYNAFIIFTSENGKASPATRSRRRLCLEELSEGLCLLKIQHRLQTP